MSIPAVVAAELSAAQAIPKSVSTARLPGPIRMFAGFTRAAAGFDDVEDADHVAVV